MKDGDFPMAMLNLSEGSSEYLTSQAAKETVPPGAKEPEPRRKWLKELAWHLLMVVFLVKDHRDSMLKMVLYDGKRWLLVGGGWIQTPHSFLKLGSKWFFWLTMRSEFRDGWCWVMVCLQLQTDFCGKNRSNCWSLLFFRELKCKQCSSTFPPSVSCSFCLPWLVINKCHMP